MNFNQMHMEAGRDGPSNGKCRGCKHYRHLYGVYCCAHPSHEGSGWRRVGEDANQVAPDWCPVPPD